ncbi:FadR/GntR family transcriptional regulator [Jatrophihabitans sp. DSM 45814]
MSDFGANYTGRPNGAVRVPKTAEIVASVLRSQIIRGEVPEGHMLPSESALVAQFGVSRPSVREALRVLESEELVSIQRGTRGGAKVRKPEMDLASRYLGRVMQFEGVTIADVWQARTLIEPVAVHLLTERKDRHAAVKTLEATLNLTIEFADDVRLYSSLSTKFHELIVSSCGNDTLAILWASLKEVLHGGTLDMSLDDDRLSRHQKIIVGTRSELLRLIDAGDAEVAETYWAEQMDVVYRRLITTKEGRKSLVEVIE